MFKIKIKWFFVFILLVICNLCFIFYFILYNILYNIKNKDQIMSKKIKVLTKEWVSNFIETSYYDKALSFAQKEIDSISAMNYEYTTTVTVVYGILVKDKDLNIIGQLNQDAQTIYRDFAYPSKLMFFIRLAGQEQSPYEKVIEKIKAHIPISINSNHLTTTDRDIIVNLVLEHIIKTYKL